MTALCQTDDGGSGGGRWCVVLVVAEQAVAAAAVALHSVCFSLRLCRSGRKMADRQCVVEAGLRWEWQGWEQARLSVLAVVRRD